MPRLSRVQTETTECAEPASELLQSGWRCLEPAGTQLIEVEGGVKFAEAAGILILWLALGPTL